MPYARILVPTEDGRFTAEVLEFPGCFAYGDTPEEAFRRLEGAAESWIEAALEQHQEIPKPFGSTDFGGKFALRLPRSLHRRAAQFAEKDQVSLNQFCVSAIAERVGAEDLLTRFADRLTGTITNVTATMFKLTSYQTFIAHGTVLVQPGQGMIGAMHVGSANTITAGTVK